MDAHAFPALVLFLFCFLLFILAFCLMWNINPFLFQKAMLVYTENPLHFNVNHNGTEFAPTSHGCRSSMLNQVKNGCCRTGSWKELENYIYYFGLAQPATHTHITLANNPALWRDMHCKHSWLIADKLLNPANNQTFLPQYKQRCRDKNKTQTGKKGRASAELLLFLTYISNCFHVVSAPGRGEKND